MKKEQIAQYIQLITWYATERGESLTVIRLVKFLYLLDLYYARGNEGKILTNCPWKFIYYGPYCSEVMEAIDYATKEGLIEATPYESMYDEKDHFLYSCPLEEEPSITSNLSIYIISSLKEAVKKYADDTPGLLDYVYFDTEPMLEVHRGELLNFSKAQMPIKPKHIEMRKVSREKLKMAKEIVANLRDRYALATEEASRARRRVLFDRDYTQAISYLDEPDLEEGLSGIAELKELDSNEKES